MSGTIEDKAADRTALYLKRAVEALNGRFGNGYSAANLQLVGAFLQSASIESAVLSGDATVAKILPRVDAHVDRMCASIEYLKPRLFG